MRQLPTFDFAAELEATGQSHGRGSLAQLQALIDQKVISRDEATRQWANSIGIAYVDVFSSVITDDAVTCIPEEIAQKGKILGLYIIDGVLTVAMASPQDTELIRRLEQITQLPISPVFALPCEIDDAIAIRYTTEKSLAESLAELEKNVIFTQTDLDKAGLELIAESDSLIKVLDEMIYFALRERASDIHIEPLEGRTRIRFRIDGKMRETITFPRRMHRAILTRLKIISSLNISESRFPQDGRFSVTIGTYKADFRFSCVPTIHGEKAVIRVLVTTNRKTALTLERMLISQPVLQPLKRLIQSPSGILFVTGPTGSGKTTTLYSALAEINKPDRNISTIEDPVEIQLEGINQSQVNTNIDVKFATLLRSFLRQDPDVILIGEIRDLETAKIATEAALTGHLVLASLHTNTAAQAIVRLMEIGVEAYMVAPAVIGVLAQRLAARICEKCKEAYYPSRETMVRYFQTEGITEVPFFRGRGCAHCRGTGYRGRVAFHELIVITEEIRQLITEGKSAQEITRAAAKIGFKPLRYDGLRKVLLGLTTIEEIEENSSSEWAT